MSISESLIMWLANGERGVSSETIVHHVAGINMKRSGWIEDYPADPSDLARCVKLLEQVPELRDGFCKIMPSIHPVWKEYVERWDELTALMDEEAPRWRNHEGKSELLYDIMHDIQKRHAKKFVPLWLVS